MIKSDTIIVNYDNLPFISKTTQINFEKYNFQYNFQFNNDDRHTMTGKIISSVASGDYRN